MIDSFRTDCIQIGTDANNKNELLKEIALLAKKSDILKDIPAAEIEERLKAREEVVSTGLANGIAIPHCSFNNIEKFVVGLIIIKKGIDFAAMDGKKTRLLFFIIGPDEARNKHIKILSSISKLSKDNEILNTLLKSDSADTAVKLLKRPENEEISLKKIEKAQFIIHIQKEELFSDVLEILSSEVEGTVSVLDAKTAGNYLNRLPLFATFWNEQSTTFSKVIIAVIDKGLMNDTIRRINLIMPEDGQGIIISVTDLIYFDGSIDF